MLPVMATPELQRKVRQQGAKLDELLALLRGGTRRIPTEGLNHDTHYGPPRARRCQAVDTPHGLRDGVRRRMPRDSVLPLVSSSQPRPTSRTPSCRRAEPRPLRSGPPTGCRDCSSASC
jgi:hypothetical protein